MFHLCSATLTPLPDQRPPTGAEREVRKLIETRGEIPFADFMEIALYHPDGYYSRQGRQGARGDYYTSPIAHPAFGALIAVQLHAMWKTLGRPSPFWVIDAGAGNGVLASDVLTFANSRFRDFSKSVRYVTLDRAITTSLHETGQRPSSTRGTGLPFKDVVGCVLSNELIDAFPVHRFEIADGRPQEILVTLDTDGNFIEVIGAPTTPLIAERIAALDMKLYDGFRGEVNLGIGPWMDEVADSLDRGYLLTIDYGYEAAELYSDDRRRGTLQSYYLHTDGHSPYQRIGRQDMTAHVDFTALIDRGLAVGLRPVFLTTQAEFLHSLGFNEMEKSVRQSNRDREEKSANLSAMRDLVNPNGLGRFKVLVQEKNTGIRRSSDLLPEAEDLRNLRSPSTSARHLPRKDAASSFEMNHLWPADDTPC